MIAAGSPSRRDSRLPVLSIEEQSTTITFAPDFSFSPGAEIKRAIYGVNSERLNGPAEQAIASLPKRRSALQSASWLATQSPSGSLCPATINFVPLLMNWIS